MSIRKTRERYTKSTIAIVGINKTSHRIVEYLTSESALPETSYPAKDGVGPEKFPRPGTCIVGVFDDRKTRTDGYVDRKWLRGDLQTLIECVREQNISNIIITIPWIAEQRILDLTRRLRTLPVQVDVCIDDDAPVNEIRNTSCVAGIPVITVANRNLHWRTFLLKRIEDILIAGSALLLLSPLLLLVSLLVKIDSKGPVLFRQMRYGFNNQPFYIYKFRSMVSTPENGEVVQATRNDSRVTRVGAFLRRTSIDELPQLYNVLEGTMSIVGPRPHAIPHNEYYGALFEEYDARHNLHPGITGWAQANGLRGETETDDKMRRRVEYDLYYIENWSLWFDIKIILLTIVNVWRHKTAY